MTLASLVTSVTTATPMHDYQVGDRVRFNGEANRFRSVITHVGSAHSFRLDTFTRPSRGFARHLRRIKQRRRKETAP